MSSVEKTSEKNKSCESCQLRPIKYSIYQADRTCLDVCLDCFKLEYVWKKYCLSCYSLFYGFEIYIILARDKGKFFFYYICDDCYHRITKPSNLVCTHCDTPCTTICARCKIFGYCRSCSRYHQEHLKTCSPPLIYIDGHFCVSCSKNAEIILIHGEEKYVRFCRECFEKESTYYCNLCQLWKTDEIKPTVFTISNDKVSLHLLICPECEKKNDICSLCSAPSQGKCTKCKIRRYCSSQCRKADKDHLCRRPKIYVEIKDRKLIDFSIDDNVLINVGKLEPDRLVLGDYVVSLEKPQSFLVFPPKRVGTDINRQD